MVELKSIPNPVSITFDPYDISRSSFTGRDADREYAEFKEMVSDREAWVLWLCMCYYLKDQYFAGYCIESAKYLREHRITEVILLLCLKEIFGLSPSDRESFKRNFMSDTLTYLRGEKQLNYRIVPSKSWRQSDREFVIRRLQRRMTETAMSIPERGRLIRTIQVVGSEQALDLEERREEILQILENA